jgi:hypothetical protein
MMNMSRYPKYYFFSPSTGHDTDFVKFLGGIHKNSTGHIVSATSLLVQFPVNNTITEIHNQSEFNFFGNKDWVTERTHVWERAFNVKMQQLKLRVEQMVNMTIYYSAASSFRDTTGDLCIKTSKTMACGFMGMFIFLLCILSNFDWLSIRVRRREMTNHLFTCFIYK